MDESQYLQLVDAAFARIQNALEAIDPDDVDAFTAGDVLTITFRDRARCVVNTQRPTRQLWVAARARAWHFAHDEATGRWLDDKGRGDELFGTLSRIIREGSGLDVTI